jgi:GNAT superfamily N-acetyltransferase
LGVIRAASVADRAALEAFLLAHIDVAMFPMVNLRDHGIGAGGFGSEHPNAARFWLLGPGIGGVVAVTRRGMIMAVLPTAAELRGLAAAMAGVMVSGAVGEAVATRRVLAALGLEGAQTRRNADEPGFALLLADLVVPKVEGAELIAADDVLREMLIGWRAAYHGEIMGTPVGDAAAIAERDIAGYIAAGSHRVLLVEGKPVAMTGFNARLPEIVQVGGVYVPPDLRRRGYARLAVALHLAEARALGATRAVLFAANDAAARAYRAIGFQRSGGMALVLFQAPHKVPA